MPNRILTCAPAAPLFVHAEDHLPLLHDESPGHRLWRLIGVCVTLLVVAIPALNKRPDLSIWHKVDLDGEFTATPASSPSRTRSGVIYF